jgi:hypothetical protein
MNDVKNILAHHWVTASDNHNRRRAELEHSIQKSLTLFKGQFVLIWDILRRRPAMQTV